MTRTQARFLKGNVIFWRLTNFSRKFLIRVFLFDTVARPSVKFGLKIKQDKYVLLLRRKIFLHAKYGYKNMKTFMHGDSKTAYDAPLPTNTLTFNAKGDVVIRIVTSNVYSSQFMY